MAEALIQQLGDTIAVLTLKQAVELREYLKDQHGIEPAGGVVVTNGPGPGDSGGTAVEPEQTTFTVVLVSAGDKKLTVIKEVRAMTGLGLKEAKEFAENPGKPIKEHVSKEEAEKIRETIEKAGGKVEIK
jgi:large subunit ribosomal protein L7/L12